MADDRKAWREYYCASIDFAYASARGDNAMAHATAVSMADRALAEEQRKFGELLRRDQKAGGK